MSNIIRANVKLIRAAPLRSLFGFGLLLPAFFLSLSIIILLAGMLFEVLVTFVFYGLSGLDRQIEGSFYQEFAKYCMDAFEFLIPFGGMGLKIFLIIPYSLAAAFLLVSAHKEAEKKEEVEKRRVEVPTDREKKIIESEMWDWEIHYKMDLNMFSSMTDFYKFLDTEVQFHAKLDGLDIEKAKEAYISWAKKNHSAEYDKLFMGFFNEILDGKKTISGKELMVRLEGVNFQAAAENITYTFREAAKKAESVGGRFIEMKEFMDATDQYIGKPCLEKAIILLEQYPSWLGLFELTKDPLIIRLRNLRNSLL